jgi:germination protein M
MLKRASIKRIALASTILLLLLMFCLFPNKKEYNLDLNGNKSVEYVNNNSLHETYLLDSDNYVARANIFLTGKTTEEKIKEILEYLIIDGKKESNIPNGFRAVIPSDTKILSIDFNDGIVKINFSKEFLDTNKEMEEKLIEAITYSLTSLKDVKGIIIYVEGELLTVLPKSGIKLPGILTRSYGINKVYDIEKTSDINTVTIYYINKYNDSYYYVPVTKYVNDDREKIKIIIDELSSGPIYESNLMSFLNTNAELLSFELKDQKLYLNFNDYLFDDIKNKKVLEEVIYSIALSVGDNYDVNEVIFMVDNKEVEKNVLKTVE